MLQSRGGRQPKPGWFWQPTEGGDRGRPGGDPRLQYSLPGSDPGTAGLLPLSERGLHRGRREPGSVFHVEHPFQRSVSYAPAPPVVFHVKHRHPCCSPRPVSSLAYAKLGEDAIEHVAVHPLSKEFTHGP